MIGRREELAAFEAACAAVRRRHGPLRARDGRGGHRQVLARDHALTHAGARDLRRRGALVRGAALRPGRAGPAPVPAPGARRRRGLRGARAVPRAAAPGARDRGPGCRGGDADRGAPARVRRDGLARARRRRARRSPLGRRGDAAAAPAHRRRSGRDARCSWSDSPATRCRPTRTVCAACARSCAGSASRSRSRCGRSRVRTPRGSPRRSPARRSTTMSSPSCTSARTASRSTSSSWRRRSRATPGMRTCSRPPLPETLLDAVLLRTDALSPASRSALERAAVFGQRWDASQVSDGADGDALAEALAAGFLVAAGPGHLEFRHALVRDAIYEAIPWTRRRALHASVARELEEAGASPPSAPPTGSARARSQRARDALTEAADASASVYAYRDAAKLYERALDLGGGTDPQRFELLEHLATARSSPAISPAPRAPGARRSTGGRAGARSRTSPRHSTPMGRVLALRGSPERALAAWSAAADSFAVVRPRRGRGPLPPRGCPDPPRRRQPPPRAGRDRGRDRRAPGRLAARSALARAFARGRGARQARPRRRKRSRACTRRCRKRSPPVSRRRPPRPTRRSPACTRTPASTARRARRSRSRSTTARARGSSARQPICSACLCHVLRQRGEWRRSLALSRTLIENPAADAGSRAIAAAVTSQIHASRGERRPARLRVMEAAPVVRQLRIFGAEMECSWTLARLEVLEGSDRERARARPRPPAPLGGERRIATTASTRWAG